MSDPIGPDLRDRLQRALGAQYQLERELGRGGMGVVFEATDSALDRRVAIKVVHPALTHQDGIVRRFLAEARMIAKFRHPGIVAVHAAGEADGLLYYVMDRVEGETLRDRLRREPKMSVDDARRITADVAMALDAAARAGLVHRDVKPENILLDGASGRPMLVDFGIARAMAGEAEGTEPTTGRGVALGTPAYMSPEQAAGEEVDARSDLYSLGVVAYEMLTGAPPFTGSHRVVISRHLTDRPTPVEKARPDSPAALSGAIMRALEKHPDERWQTGEALSTALSGETAAFPRRARKRRFALLAGAAVLLVGAVAVKAMNKDGPPRGVNPRQSILVLPFANVRADSSGEWLRDGSVNMLSLALGQWNDLQVIGPERVHDLMEAARIRDGGVIGLDEARRLARKAGVWTVVLGEFDRSGDTLRLAARVVDVASGKQVDLARVEAPTDDEVRPLFDRLAARLLDISGAPRGERVALAQSTTRSVEAYRAYLAGDGALNHWDLPAAEAALRKAIAADSTFGLAYYKLSVTRGWMHGAGDSIGSDAIARAEVYASPLPVREQTMIQAYRTFLQGANGDARRLYQELLAKNPGDPDAWYGLGDAWFHDEKESLPFRFTESMRAFKRALELDPGYALAFEHVNFILGRASRQNPMWVLLPNDSISFVYGDKERRLIDSAATREAVQRARAEAIRLARDWANLQPATAKAHEALLAALIAAQDYNGAENEVARFRAVVPNHPELPFDDARIRFASGDAPRAARQLGVSIDSLTPEDLRPISGATDAAERLVIAANMLAYQGNVGQAAKLIDLANRVRFGDPAAGSAAATERDAWNWRMQGELYAAVGVPTAGMRRIWQSAAEASRSVAPEKRAKYLAAGGAAAVGLLTSATPDESAVNEMQAMGGTQPAKEVRALMALENNDKAGARKALAEPDSLSMSMKGPSYLVFRRPLAAQAYYLLGDYERALKLLEGFDGPELNADQFDMRWGIVGRVRLLRGAVYEKLGRPDDAREQYKLALAQWSQADPDLQVFVQEAQQKLAQLQERS
jgi:tetratricopeptide (TPR) repeat protein